MNSPIRLIELDGPELGPWVEALGELRITVFREFPYLYDGTLEYEREYLSVYQKSPRCRVILALGAGGVPVGATTCMPLCEESAEFLTPFEVAGMDPARILYLGESVVLREFRGGGLGAEFFRRREAHARRLGLDTCAFCAVDRPPDHPLRGTDHRPLDAFWSRMGYTCQPELRASFSWREIGENSESPKTLTFWTKSWNA